MLKIERYEEAVSAFDICIENGRKFSHDMPGCVAVAEALFGKGLAYDDLHRHDLAIDAYNELWACYFQYADRDQNIKNVRQLLARSRTNLGLTLQDLHRFDEALVCFRQVIENFGEDARDDIYEPVVKALVHTGIILDNQKHDREGAIKSYDEVLNKFGTSAMTALRDPVLKALANKGMALKELDRLKEAIAVYGELLERVGATPDKSLYGLLAGVLNTRGRLLGLQGDYDEALSCFDKVLEYADERDPELAQALAYKSTTLARLGRNDEAINTADRVLDILRRAGRSAVNETTVINALGNKARVLVARSQPEHSLAAYAELVSLLRDSRNAITRKHVALAMEEQERILSALGRASEAQKISDDLKRFRNEG